jgi:PAS domain S-box-containing protein
MNNTNTQRFDQIAASIVNETLQEDIMIKDHVQKLGEECFQTLIAELEDYAIFLLDPDGIISTWNKGAQRIKGYLAEDVIGKSHKLFYTAEDREARMPEKLINLAIQNGKVIHEGWRVRKNGEHFWGNVTITALHNDKGGLTGFLKVTRDLTERRNAEIAQYTYTQQLEKNNEALRKSEERYHKMVAEVQDYAIILLDPTGIVLDWNKGAQKVKGYLPEEIIGKSFKLFYTPEDLKQNFPERLLHEAVVKGSTLNEGWRMRKDGTRFWGSVSITALHGSHGEITGFSKVTRDLTVQKIADDQLREFANELKSKNEILRKSEERYHRMIDEVQDYAILLLSKEGNIENWNSGAMHIKGYTAEEIVGKHFRIFYPSEDAVRGLPEQLLEIARRTGRATHEGWRVRKNGTRFWGNVVITALHDDDHNIVGYTKVTRDLTDRKKAEDTLRENAIALDQKNKALENLNSELSSFVYVASHDMKEPLRKIQTYVSMFDEQLSERGKTYLERIGSSAARMQSLIEDLLSYSQVSNDSSAVEELDLNQLLDTVKHDLEVPIAQRKAIVQSSTLPKIKGVRFQLYQVFLNILSNALKFSKEHEVPQVKIHADVVSRSAELPPRLAGLNQSYHHITIRDNGIGFEAENSNRIFEVFQRLHPKHTYSGTGIGLAIVKKVMDNHNGLVMAESQPGSGAAFHLYFPAETKVQS